MKKIDRATNTRHEQRVLHKIDNIEDPKIKCVSELLIDGEQKTSGLVSILRL